MRPLVGITAWRRKLDTYLGPEILQTLSAYYSDSVIAAGMTPMIFPNAQNTDEAGRLVGLVDGVIISGGDDVDPSSYDEEKTRSKGNDPAVDGFEVAVVRAARSQGKPVLAICRGLQLLNVALGGTLEQEITSPGTAHEPINDDSDPDEVNSRHHIVTFEEGGLLAEIYGSQEAKVNTLHHQGIANLAPELILEGRADDGLIEAARFAGDWWAVGVQWHPERMEGDHQSIFTALREAIKLRGRDPPSTPR